MYFLKRSVLRAGMVSRHSEGTSEQNWRIKFPRWGNFMLSENMSEPYFFSLINSFGINCPSSNVPAFIISLLCARNCSRRKADALVWRLVFGF